jgi:hypothetical protein
MRIRAEGKTVLHAWSFSLPLPLTEPYFLRSKPGNALTEVTVVLLDAKPPRTRAAAIRYDVAAKKTAPPVWIADVAGHMAAADMTPLSDAAPAVVTQQLHLLTGPDDRRQMAYYTMPPSGAAPSPKPRRFAAPVAAIDGWSITATLEAHPVLAKAGPRLFVARSAGAAWNALASAALPPSHALISSENPQECYAEWLDPDHGFRMVRIIGD